MVERVLRHTVLRRMSVALLLSACFVLTACDQKTQDKHNSPSTSADNHDGQASVQVKMATVRSEGIGKTSDEALQNALVLAVGQVSGAKVMQSTDAQSLVADYHAQISGNAQADVSASGSGAAHVTGIYSETASAQFSANEKIVNTSSRMSGTVKRFQVVGQIQNSGYWHVTIVADVPVYQASAASKRLKIAVLPFHSAGKGGFENSVRSHLIDILTGSGKVAVLDRDYSQESDAELSQLSGDSVAKEEVAKLGHRLGADYIIVGSIGKTSVHTDAVYMVALGQKFTGASHASGQISYRVIEVATGVVLMSGSVGAAQSGGNLEALAASEAGAISHKVLDSLYPVKVVSVADGVVYLSRGGDSIRVGDSYQVMLQGKSIIDPDTHEVIGSEERAVAQIVITEVDAKLSKARIASGAVALNAGASLVVRPVATAAPAKPPVRAAAVPSGKDKARASTSASHAQSKEGVDY
jgi:hypothetical protein